MTTGQRGGEKELGSIIELDDALTDRRDEEGSGDGQGLFPGNDERDKVKGKQRDTGSEKQLYKTDSLWLQSCSIWEIWTCLFPPYDVKSQFWGQLTGSN
jgi:hypothetical protein